MNKLLLGLVFFSVSSMAADVYMSHDENGNIIFSDMPSSDSRVHKVKALPTMPATKTATLLEAEPASSKTDVTFSYSSLNLLSPAHNQVFSVGEVGNVAVAGVLSPTLRPGDTVVVLDNGAQVANGKSTNFNLANLDRGEHTLQLQVKDRNGKVVISSNPVTIHVQRTRLLNKRPR